MSIRKYRGKSSMSYNQIEDSKRSTRSLVLDLKKILLDTINELNGAVGINNSKKIIKTIFDRLNGELKILKDIEELSKTDPEQALALNEIYIAKYVDRDHNLAKDLFNKYKEKETTPLSPPY